MTELKVSPSQFLRRTGLTTVVMRLLEVSGVVSPTRTDTGWRQFTEQDVERALAWKESRHTRRGRDRV